MQTELPLETERLTLRPFTAGDFDAVHSYRSRDDVARFLYWEANTEQEVRRTLEQKAASTSIHAEGDALALAIVVRETASARVLEKLGFRREAHLIQNEWVKGEWQSELVYAILDREWREVSG